MDMDIRQAQQQEKHHCWYGKNNGIPYKVFWVISS